MQAFWNRWTLNGKNIYYLVEDSKMESLHLYRGIECHVFFCFQVLDILQVHAKQCQFVILSERVLSIYLEPSRFWIFTYSLWRLLSKKGILLFCTEVSETNPLRVAMKTLNNTSSCLIFRMRIQVFSNNGIRYFGNIVIYYLLVFSTY